VSVRRAEVDDLAADESESGIVMMMWDRRVRLSAPVESIVIAPAMATRAKSRSFSLRTPIGFRVVVVSQCCAS